MKVGKASFGNKKKEFKIKDGSNVFRVLPALGNLADSGTWYVYNRVEWGFKDSDGVNRPFLDVRQLDFDNRDDDGNFLVKVESAAYTQREKFKARKIVVSDLLRTDRTNSDLLEEMKELNENLKRYNLDAKYYLNVVNLQGEIGLLKIGATHFKALKAKRDKIMETKGEDILAINGGYFMDFSRTNETGKITDYVFEVTEYQENVVVDGETYQKTKKHNMDDVFIGRLGSEARELSGMFRTVTAEQVERFVTEGVPAIEEVLGRAKGEKSGNSNTTSNTTNTTSSVSSNVSNSNSTVAEKKVEQRAEAVVEAPVTSMSNAVLDKLSKSEQETVRAPAETPTSSTMSEEDFLKSIGAI